MALSWQYCDQVGRLFRHYVHEPDTSFLTNADVAAYLHSAHEEFRDWVAGQDRTALAERVKITVTDALEFDLTTLTNYPKHIVGVYPMNGNDPYSVNGHYTPATSYDELREGEVGKYFWMNTRLLFGTNQDGDFALEFVREVSIDWTQLTAGDNEEIETNRSLRQYHDMIALIAASAYYAPRDGAESDVLERRLQRRQLQVVHYLMHRLEPGKGHTVARTNWEREYD